MTEKDLVKVSTKALHKTKTWKKAKIISFDIDGLRPTKRPIIGFTKRSVSIPIAVDKKICIGYTFIDLFVENNELYVCDADFEAEPTLIKNDNSKFYFNLLIKVLIVGYEYQIKDMCEKLEEHYHSFDYLRK